MSKEAEENLRRQIERQRFDIDMLKFKLENCQSENAALRKALEKIASMVEVCPDDLSAQQARAALEVKP